MISVLLVLVASIAYSASNPDKEGKDPSPSPRTRRNLLETSSDLLDDGTLDHSIAVKNDRRLLTTIIVYGDTSQDSLHVYYQISATFITDNLLCSYRSKGSSSWISFGGSSLQISCHRQCPPWSKGNLNYDIKLSLNGVDYITDEETAKAHGTHPGCASTALSTTENPTPSPTDSPTTAPTPSPTTAPTPSPTTTPTALPSTTTPTSSPTAEQCVPANNAPEYCGTQGYAISSTTPCISISATQCVAYGGGCCELRPLASNSPTTLPSMAPTGAGGGRLIVRTNGMAHNEVGDMSSLTVQTSDDGQTGIFPAFQEYIDTDKITIYRVDDQTSATFQLVAPLTTSLESTILGCGETDIYTNSASTTEWTAMYSGTRVSGDLYMTDHNGQVEFPEYMFICGVNLESDTDHSVLAFTDNTGQNGNGWGDGWRGLQQRGTLWSLFNDDYKGGRGWSSVQGWPGYKGSNDGTYEIYLGDVLPASNSPTTLPSMAPTGVPGLFETITAIDKICRAHVRNPVTWGAVKTHATYLDDRCAHGRYMRLTRKLQKIFSIQNRNLWRRTCHYTRKLKTVIKYRCY